MDFKKRRGPDSLRAAIWTTSELFLRHFKNSLNGLIQSQFVNQNRSYNVDILCS